MNKSTIRGIINIVVLLAAIIGCCYFAKGINEPKGIVFYGTSLTKGFALTEYLGAPVQNSGEPGSDIKALIIRLAKNNFQYKKIFIESGINDVGRNIPEQIIINNYCLVIDILRTNNPEAEIYIQSILPTYGPLDSSNFYGPAANAEIIRINQALKNYCLVQKCTFIDTHSRLTDPKYFMPDGLHVSPAGYALWASILRPHIK